MSDIYQSGETEEQLYAEVAAMVKERGIKKFIGVGKALNRQKQAFDSLKDKFFFENTADFIESNVF